MKGAFTCRVSSPLGEILLSSDGEALTGLWFLGQKHFPAALPEKERELPVFGETKKWLELYFSGKDPGFSPALAPEGTAFQREVWEILRRIPYGESMTYGQIARILAQRRGLSTLSAQAVGQAVGRNPISLIVPCHRVLGAKGGIVGYAGGTEKKKRLLEMEGILPLQA